MKALTNDEINSLDEDGYTLLHKAAVAGELEEVKKLIKLGADPTIIDFNGLTAKDLATEELNKQSSFLGMISGIIDAERPDYEPIIKYFIKLEDDKRVRELMEESLFKKMDKERKIDDFEERASDIEEIKENRTSDSSIDIAKLEIELDKIRNELSTMIPSSAGTSTKRTASPAKSR